MGDFFYLALEEIEAATDWDLKAKGLAERHTPESPTRKQVLRIWASTEWWKH